MGARGLLSFSFLALLLGSSVPVGADSSRGITIPSRVRPSPLDEMTADGRPTPAGIAMLRSHNRDHMVRLWVGDSLLKARRVEIDSLEVTLVGEPRANGSPIPWTAIARLETRHSSLLTGIALGTLLGAAAALAVDQAAGPDPGPGILIIFALPPAGAVLGGLIGAPIPRWRHEWPPRTRPSSTMR